MTAQTLSGRAGQAIPREPGQGHGDHSGWIRGVSQTVDDAIVDGLSFKYAMGAGNQADLSRSTRFCEEASFSSRALRSHSALYFCHSAPTR